MQITGWSGVTSLGARAVVAGLLLMAVVACGDAADGDTQSSQAATQDGAATHDMALLETPCKLMPTALLADVFALPAAEIEQTPINIMGRGSCSSDWEGDDKSLSVEMIMQVFETTEQAAIHFKNATRSTTKEDMEKAMQALKAHRKKDDTAADTTAKKTQNSLLTAMLSRPIIFEDVADIGDEARFGTTDGKMVVRSGNLIVSVSAYYGADMPMPNELTTSAIMKASTEWKKKTIAERKQQSADVARATIEAL